MPGWCALIETYEHGDDDYDDLYAVWVAEGSPATFDRIGLFGGEEWYALGWQRETYPAFLLSHADGPTELSTSDDMDETGLILKKGYSETRGKDGGLNIKFYPGVGWQIRTRSVHKEDN